MKILISPYSAKLKSGKENAKNYPWWNNFIDHCMSYKEESYYFVQVGVTGEKPLENIKEFYFDRTESELIELVNRVDLFMSVDNMFPHLCATNGIFGGMVIFGPSDPRIFGYDKNINVSLHRKFLREDQFGSWENVRFNEDLFPFAYNLYDIMIHRNDKEYLKKYIRFI